MAQQTGSISFEAVGGFSSYASGQFTTTEDVAQMSQPNLSPYFSHPLSDVYNATTNPNGYWTDDRTALYTELGDGWAHIEVTAGTSSTAFGACYVTLAPSGLKPSSKYTFLVEWRNVTVSRSTGEELIAYFACASDYAPQPDAFAGGTRSTEITGTEGSKHVAATTLDDLSGISVFSRGYLGVRANGTFSGDLRVSLYEGEYSGPYKPYVDQSLITRVSTAETAIEQNAENILLRATKTEAYQVAQPNLAPITAAPLDSVYNATTNPNGYWKTTPSSWFTSLEDGWIRVYRDNSEGTAAANTTTFRPRACPSIVPGETYTILIEVRNNHSTGSGNTDMYIQQVANNQFWGSGGGNIQPLTFGEETVIHSPKVADTAHLTSDPVELFRYNARCNAGSVLDFELRLSIYEGTYDGPYKPYSGTQLYASQAQLKVANDEIDLRVEKSGVIAAINASTEAEGGSAVKIQADKVNIEGAAIFTSGRLSEDSLDEVMSGNLLGNTRNAAWTDLNCDTASLTYGDMAPYNTLAVSRSVEAYDEHSNAAVLSNDTKTGNRGVGWYTRRGAVKAGVTYAFSCMVWASRPVLVHTHTGWRTSESSEYSGWVSEGNRNVPAETWTLYTHSFTPSSNANLTWEFLVGICFTGNASGVTFKVAHAKLEEGGVATPWGGVSAVEVGGGNLLRSSGVWENGTWNTSTGAHNASTTRLRSSKDGWYVPVEPNATYVIGRHAVDSSVDYYVVLYAYDSSGAFVLTDSVTEWITSFPYTYVPAAATRLEVGIRRSDNADISVSEAAAARIKVERGNRASDWSPAPEDQTAYVDSSIDSIQIGGRNLLRWTGKPECTGVTYSSSIAADECTGWYVYGTRGTYARTDDGIKVTMKTSGNSSGFAIPFAHDGSIADGDVVTLSFDYRGTMTNTGRLYVLCRETPNSYWSPMTLTSDGTWAHFEATLDTADLNTALGDRIACALLIPYLNTASVWLEIRDGSMKLEKGNKATGWSPAPEDVDSSIDGISIGGRNLLLGTADWSKWENSAGTTISGDEATYTANNTNNRLAPFAVTPGETYTVSVDIKADAEYTYGTTGNTFLLLDYSEAGGYHRVTSVWILYGTKLTTEWQRVSETFTVPTTATIAQLYVSLRNAGSNPPTYTLRHMKVEKGNRPTEWTPAPEDVTSRTQRIYYRTSSSTAPTSQYMPTAWVTETGDKWAANSTTVANWTAKATKLTNGSGTKYPYLFTCEQRQMGDGTLAYTTVLLDETTTVIDGGNIITHSVTANEIDATDLYVKSANIDGLLKAEQIDVENLKVPFSNFTDGDADFTNLKDTIDDISEGYQEADAALQVAIDELSGSLDGYESKADAELAHTALAADIAAASATATAAKNDVSDESAWRAKRFTDSSGKTDFHADGGAASLVIEADSAAFMADELEVARMDVDGIHASNVYADTALMMADWAWLVRDNGNLALKWVGEE